MKLAVIPARGGSKRIPRKNSKLFHGKPMIAYSIEAAFASGCFDKVLVSTDDDDIRDIALSYGASVPFVRPAEIANDHASSMDVMAHAVAWCQAAGWQLDAVCCLYATAPFVQAADLQQGYQQLVQSDALFVFSATSFAFPIQRAITLNEQGRVSMLYPENEQVRSQDLPAAYHDAGQFYWGRANAFLTKQAIFAAHSQALILPRSRVQDIDTPEDWAFAEALFKAQQLNKVE